MVVTADTHGLRTPAAMAATARHAARVSRARRRALGVRSQLCVAPWGRTITRRRWRPMRRRRQYSTYFAMRRRQKGRTGEASNPGPETKVRKTFEIQQINITQLDKNGGTLVENDADVIGTAESKLGKTRRGSGKRFFKMRRRCRLQDQVT